MKRALKSTSQDGPVALEARLSELDRKLDRLRALYESFFLGIERAPPNVPRRDLNRLILELQQEPISNASLRFRFQSVMQRWVLYTSYWNRTLREIEAGTFRRDLARAQKHITARGALSEQEALALGIPAARVKAFVEKQRKLQTTRESRTGAVAVAAPVAPCEPAPEIPGLASAEVEAAYQQYAAAKRRLSGDQATLPSLQRVREKLGAQIPRILEEQRCARVRLEVVVEGDKVHLRARPEI